MYVGIQITMGYYQSYCYVSPIYFEFLGVMKVSSPWRFGAGDNGDRWTSGQTQRFPIQFQLSQVEVESPGQKWILFHNQNLHKCSLCPFDHQISKELFYPEWAQLLFLCSYNALQQKRSIWWTRTSYTQIFILERKLCNLFQRCIFILLRDGYYN